MEGAGSRLGRASSRFGPVTSSPLFTGPVRKWKRQWVFSSQSDDNKKTAATANNLHDGATPSLLLPRWTPLSSDSGNLPKRKFRYTPVVDLKQKKSEANREADGKSKAGDVNQSTVCDTQSTDIFGKLNVDEVVMKEVQELTKDLSPSTEEDHKMDWLSKTHTEDNHTSGKTKLRKPKVI